MPAFRKKFKKKIYIKDESFDPIYKTVNYNFLIKSRMIPGILISLGFLILGTQVIYPLVYFKTADQVTTPVESSVLGIASGFSDFEFSELNVNNRKNLSPDTDYPDFFHLSIPKLNIQDALVETNSPTLQPDEALGHYRGSALPGQVGNTFIYGHSVLPWFFNSKNYKTIFSTLDDLETGDKIKVKYKDSELTYKVETKAILPVNQVKPLEEWKPEYLNDSTIELMTCWPAGTKAKRLVVRAVLTD